MLCDIRKCKVEPQRLQQFCSGHACFFTLQRASLCLAGGVCSIYSVHYSAKTNQLLLLNTKTFSLQHTVMFGYCSNNMTYFTERFTGLSCTYPCLLSQVSVVLISYQFKSNLSLQREGPQASLNSYINNSYHTEKDGRCLALIVFSYISVVICNMCFGPNSLEQSVTVSVKSFENDCSLWPISTTTLE